MLLQMSGYPTNRPSENLWGKCKCTMGRIPMAHWAMRSELEAAGAQWCAGYDSEPFVQMARERPRAIRFRIPNPTSPTPISMRPTVDGSGVGVTSAVSEPEVSP